MRETHPMRLYPISKKTGDEGMKKKVIIVISVSLLLASTETMAIKIKNNSSKYCLDTDGAIRDGGKVRMWECVSHPNQSWNVVYMDSQFVKFKNKTSEYCLDTDGAAVNGGKVRMWSCANHPNQLWRINNINGNTRIINEASGYCLDTDGRAVNDGEVRMYKCTNHPNQLWQLQDEQPAELVGSIHTGPGKCDGLVEGFDNLGGIIDSGWISLYSDSMLFKLGHTDCGGDDKPSNLPDYGNKSAIHTGPAKCDNWWEGVDWNGARTSSGWILLSSRDSASTAFNAFFVINHDDCGNKKASCPAGYESKGRIHTGPGICDGNVEGIDRNGNVIDSGWMELCALKKSDTVLRVTHDDCSNISNSNNGNNGNNSPPPACGGHNQLACRNGNKEFCNSQNLSLYNHGCFACGVIGTPCCKQMSSPDPGGAYGICINGVCGYPGGYCQEHL